MGVWGRCLRGPGTGRYDCHTSHTCDLAHRQLRVSSWGFPPQKQEFEDRCPLSESEPYHQKTGLHSSSPHAASPGGSCAREPAFPRMPVHSATALFSRLLACAMPALPGGREHGLDRHRPESWPLVPPVACEKLGGRQTLCFPFAHPPDTESRCP